MCYINYFREPVQPYISEINYLNTSIPHYTLMHACVPVYEDGCYCDNFRKEQF